MRNIAAGINILGYDSAQRQRPDPQHQHPAQPVQRVTTALDGNGWFLLIGHEPRDIVVDHNTIDHDGTTVGVRLRRTVTSPMPIAGFQFTNNAVRHGEYGINGANFSTPGRRRLSAYFPGAVVNGNWMPGGNSSRYPAGNIFSGSSLRGFVSTAEGDYRAAAGGILTGAATDGTDIGADIETLTRRTAGVIEGRPGADLAGTPPRPPPPRRQPPGERRA